MADLEVDLDRLKDHAKQTGEVADGVAEAADAARHVAALDDAYGWTCQSLGLPEKLRGPQDRGAALITGVADDLRRDSTELAGAEKTYGEVDEKITAVVNDLIERLVLGRKPPRVGR
ncbi:type VII secretion target [Actinosynnema sp. NPDC020468]|uniref:type VII secretion target n=1 Tax=Actinosynnema sp. NPDC020468 TaxID=3154488 RepID=UPI00340932E2